MFYYTKNFIYMEKYLEFGRKKIHYILLTPQHILDQKSLLKVFFSGLRKKSDQNRKFISDRV